MGRLFGTDGIRGLANGDLLTPELALKVGQAAGRHFRNGTHRHRVLIGKDTRRSGYMLEQALTAGFTSVGMDVVQVGPLPTPAVAMLTREMRADLGVMISASHNPFFDNGIKLFGPDGYKLSDGDEAAIEALLDAPVERAAPQAIGRARRIDDARGRYIHAVKSTFPEGVRLDGLRIVLDCAHGAAYRVAPEALWELGADLITVGTEPDGFNINDGCGSVHPGLAAARVRETGAHLGIALDGDADRVVLIDERGALVDGDQILALIARSALEAGRLRGGHVVATVMSNLGLERFLEGLGVGLVRTPVGDRHVLAALRARGCNVGGEPSGHLILLDHATTGDGLVAALQVLAVLVRCGRPASEILHLFDPLPQLLENVRGVGAAHLDRPVVKAAIAQAEAVLAGRGRLVVRPSGTEPVVRVMAEADDEALVRQAVAQVKDALEAAA
ncbi:MAG: phosphoglucosamine mutase [Sphingomonadaceae bacterium]|uniref:phosphoglucosamine mutase n=1 Tax=Thermaurantiacus sp. TaxID=2820283 RepID=UPI00298F3AF9|nr:phosphoglucosamine mutase [Thermaurantiacus sp.]MCS6987855.1 phosphoglucosamine mutase [Sphingomonadaceae bacterium]MDW8414925.1 phosphoglucosamine mutase [Thermaurantiacus sp.]